MMSFDLRGKTLVITGAASGIGLATAERAAAAGATVVLADRDDASDAAAAIGGKYVHVDVTDEASVAALMSEAARTGPLHAVVMSAGVTSEGTLDGLTHADLQYVLAVNTFGPMYGFKHAPGYMADGGAIVVVASLAASVGIAGYGAYSASKAATIALTRTAAVELGARGIRVNAICPSAVETPMLLNQNNGAAESALCSTASTLGVINTPAQIAAIIHFLVADDCPTISGQALHIDAGMTAGYSTSLLDELFTSERFPEGATS